MILLSSYQCSFCLVSWQNYGLRMIPLNPRTCSTDYMYVCFQTKYPTSQLVCIYICIVFDYRLLLATAEDWILHPLHATQTLSSSSTAQCTWWSSALTVLDQTTDMKFMLGSLFPYKNNLKDMCGGQNSSTCKCCTCLDLLNVRKQQRGGTRFRLSVG